MADKYFQLSLSRDAETFVERESKVRGFDTPAAYVENLVRDAQRQAARDRAEQLVQEGVASGEPVVADDAFWARLRSELNSRVRYPKTA
jgi:hypothetical protein